MKERDREDFDRFLEGQVLSWKRGATNACSLPIFLGMSDKEYGDWFLHQLSDQGYERIISVWDFV